MGANLPTVDLGRGRKAVALSASASHTCAILDDASLKCWGYNLNGQLGQGDSDNRGDAPNEMGDFLNPVALGNGHTVLAVAAGWEHTCAILDNHRVKCWGYNGDGQLGYGDKQSTRGNFPNTMGDNLECVQLGTDFEAVAIAAGEGHNCVISSVGTVKCWGVNGIGQLGLGDSSTRGDEPSDMGDDLPEVDLGTGRTAVAITAGKSHSCALLDDGSAKCWGNNCYGQLGYGDQQHRGNDPGEMGDALQPIDLGSHHGRAFTVVAIQAGEEFTCAILHNGWVKCWGQNADGQLGVEKTDTLGDGDGEMGDFLQAVSFGGGLTAVALEVGKFHAVAVLGDGSVKAWGENGSGQLGLGDTNNRGDASGEMGDNLPAVDLGGDPAAVCALGSYLATAGCKECPAGTRGLAMADSEGDCIECTAGYVSAAGSALCSPCAAGRYFSAAAASCELCPAGKYSTVEGATNSSVCLSCPPGTYSTKPGLPSSDGCGPMPPQEARCYIVQAADDKLPLRVDDEEDDSTYFFVDQFGRVGINTSVFDESEETLIVSGSTRLRGPVYLDDDEDEEATLQNQLARRVEHASAQSNMLLQHGRLELVSEVDECGLGSDIYCASVSLASPVLEGTQAVMLTVKLTSEDEPPAPLPSAWVSGLDIDDGDDDYDGNGAVIVGFSIQAVAPAADPQSVVAEIHWVLTGVAA